MANPFFSGRIPPALAIQIDAHLMVTGETRSELLVRLLRHEVSDNKPDNAVDIKSDDVITNLLSRVERLERLIDNKPDNVPDIKPDSIEIVEATEVEPGMSLNMEALAKRLKVPEKRLRASATSKDEESWRELMESNPDPESLRWARPVKVGNVWRIVSI
jgi:hypothetical protein